VIRETTNFEGLTGPLAFTKEGFSRRPVFVVKQEGGGPKLVKKYGPEPEASPGKSD
jgi:hypothetical protein